MKENVIVDTPGIKPRPLGFKVTFCTFPCDARVGTLQISFALPDGFVILCLTRAVQTETTKLEEEEATCSFLPVSCLYQYYPSNVASLRQWFLPIAVEQCSLNFSNTSRTSSSELVSETPASAEQNCSSALQALLWVSDFDNPRLLPSCHRSPRGGIIAVYCSCCLCDTLVIAFHPVSYLVNSFIPG